MSLEYVGWKIVCDQCGETAWLKAPEQSRPGMIEAGGCAAIDLGWGYKMLSNHSITTGKNAYWMCSKCYEIYFNQVERIDNGRSHMTERKDRIAKVVREAMRLVNHRKAAAIQHFDGYDEIGNEMESTEWMYYEALENAVKELQPTDLEAEA